MAKSDRAERQMPGADPAQFLSMIRNAADAVLLLDSDRTVTDVVLSDSQQTALPASWVGRRFADLLGPESISKVEGLFAQDVCSLGTKARWRHLNLSDDNRGTVPLLLKFASFRGDDIRGGLLMARDLRPTVELQNRFMASHNELEAQLETRHANRQSEPSSNGAQSPASRVGGVVVADMMAKLGHRPLNGIMRETTRILERLCVSEALGRSQGDRTVAARMLGITVEELHLAMLN